MTTEPHSNPLSPAYHHRPCLDPQALGLVTDLYQLTMMAGYRARGVHQRPAIFEVFIRRLPPGRGAMIFAGLEPLLQDLINLRFSAEQIEWLKSLAIFQNAMIPSAFWEELAVLRFTGDVWAMREGEVAFANEPLMRVQAPLSEAQWIESYVLASLSYPTLVATKAARMVQAAKGRPVIDFGLRRGHGPHAGLLAARVGWIAGFAGTSHVEAARLWNIPAFGTMAHAWIQSYGEERETDAFAEFAALFPHAPTVLVDTFETLEGIRKAARIHPPVAAIRLDSGDLPNLARRARAILDDHQRSSTRIFASGDLDEYKIDALTRAEVPIDAFGVGTEFITGGDIPKLSIVYKLVELDGRPVIKRAEGKRTHPFGKQVWRSQDCVGIFRGDYVTHRDESAEGEPLLIPAIAGGRLVEPRPNLETIRAYCADRWANIPAELRDLQHPGTYPVSYSERLERASRAMGL